MSSIATASIGDLRVFLAIAEHRSFRSAAKALGLSPSALSHTIRNLEERMAVRLLNRTTRSVALTDAGERLLIRVRPALNDIEDAVAEIAASGDRPKGSLRVSVTGYVAALIIAQVLPRFLDEYPDISVELIADGRFVDIVSNGFDAGVRLFEAVQKDMIAMRFGPRLLRSVVVASPGYLAGRVVPASPQDLSQHRCIRFRFDSGALYRWEFEKDGRAVKIDVNGSLTVTKIELSVAAAVAGLGIGLVPEPLALGHIREGRLIQLLEDWTPPFEGFCLYYPANRYPPAALRLFAEALRDWTIDGFPTVG